MKQRRNRALSVKVARDVLAQLRLKRYKAKERVYVDVNLDIDLGDLTFEESDKLTDESFQAYFKKHKKVTCDVCALGSCFVSLVNIKNKCDVGEMINDDTAMDLTFERLIPVFGRENMSLMESAFECEKMDHTDCSLSNEMLVAAGDWGNKYKDANERLRAIMLNVIRNKGDFKLPKKVLISVRREEAEIGY